MKKLIIIALILLSVSCSVDRGLYSNKGLHPTYTKSVKYNSSSLIAKY